MTEYRVNSGHVIMRQNDHGDKFYGRNPLSYLCRITQVCDLNCIRV
jgi:hypothetical protein